MSAFSRKPSLTENPLAGTNVRNLLVLLHRHGFEARFAARVLYVATMVFATAPLRLAQRLVFGRSVHRTRIHPSPVFVIGHYRCGTTYLVNLLVQDPRVGFVTTTQAVVPEAFLLGWPVREILRIFLPPKRPMDGVDQAPELPEEPEHAIANLSPDAFIHAFCFPRDMEAIFRRSVLLDVPGADPASLMVAYTEVLRAATLAARGKRLVVKNPPDTARIPLLLGAFPEARFVYITRDPFVTFCSIRRFYRACLYDWQLQSVTDEALEEQVFRIYERLLERYHADKAAVPSGHLAEVRFEDLERDPVGSMERIYLEASLGDFEPARELVAQYAATKAGYVKNRYTLEPRLIGKVATRWGDEIERYGYAYATSDS